MIELHINPALPVLTYSQKNYLECIIKRTAAGARVYRFRHGEGGKYFHFVTTSKDISLNLSSLPIGGLGYLAMLINEAFDKGDGDELLLSISEDDTHDSRRFAVHVSRTHGSGTSQTFTLSPAH